MLLQHRLREEENRGGIEIIKNSAVLPKVTGYAAQHNRVVMNIIINAIDALEEIRYNEKESKTAIAISTGIGEDKNLVIRIADNGPGMTSGVMQKIFSS